MLATFEKTLYDSFILSKNIPKHNFDNGTSSSDGFKS